MPDQHIGKKAKRVLAVWKQFIQFLDSSGHQDVKDKEELRKLFKLFKTSHNITGCSFATLIHHLQGMKMIRYKKGLITRQRPYDTVSIDQHWTIKSAQDGSDDRTTDAGQGPTSPNFPWVCKPCGGAKIYSEVDYQSHINGKRHQANLLKRRLNAKKGSLLAKKQGITVTSRLEENKGSLITTMKKEERKEIVFTITAEGDGAILVRIKLEGNQLQNFKVTDQHQVSDGKNTVNIPKGASYDVLLTCNKASCLGSQAVAVLFLFQKDWSEERFVIWQPVVITVVSDVSDDLPESKPYIKPPRFSGRARRGAILAGEPPLRFADNPLKGKKLNMYKVPKDLEHTVNNKDKLQVLREQLKEPLVVENHRMKFQVLLHVEELQMMVDIRRYDRQGQTLHKEKGSSLFKLNVPGLAENRPSVQKGDDLFARFSDNSDDNAYQGFVHRVEQEDVILSFHKKFLSKYVNGMKVDIEFTFSRYPLRLQHHAVNTAMTSVAGSLCDLLFPDSNKIGKLAPLPRAPEDIETFQGKLYDHKLAANPEQLKAVHRIVSGTSRPAPYLVFGPPGTGKTVTIVEAAKQVVRLLPRCRILLSAPSNSAADLLAVRLLALGTGVNKTPIAKTELLRFYATSRPPASLDPNLKAGKCCNLKNGELYIPTREEIESKRVIVTTLCNAGKLALAQFPLNFFTHVFVDEAGHATEPETLNPLSGIIDLASTDGGQVVLTGDPKQLGPVLRSPLCIEYGLGLSLLERLMTNCPVYARKPEEKGAEPYDPRVLTKLLQNYRSHPDILRLPNEEFYDNELKVCADKAARDSFCSWDELPKKGFPIIFHGVEGKNEREEHSPSFFNRSEVEIVVDYVKKVMNRGGIKQEDIGVISPYRKQVEKLRLVLRKRRYEKIKVGSVEEFQGQERPVIIISTVRSPDPEFIKMDMNFKLGFLKNPKRYNVSVTRAKALLVIVGNPFLLSKDEHWNRMLEFCIKHGGYCGCRYTPETEDEDDELVQLLKGINLDADSPTDDCAEGLPFSPAAIHDELGWARE